MSLLMSLYTGKEGSYTVMGIPVEFVSRLPSKPPNLFRDKEIQGLIDQVNSMVFPKIILAVWMRTFVHEMGHALSYQILTNRKIDRIIIDVQSGAGATVLKPDLSGTIPRVKPWQEAIFLAAGPCYHLSVCAQLPLFLALGKDYLPKPLLLAQLTANGISALGELGNAALSAINQDQGDFARLVRLNPMYGLVAGISLVSLAIFTGMSSLALIR